MNPRRNKRVTLILLPPDKGRKTPHLAVMSHYGGGWYQIACCGGAKKCREGNCKHTADMRLQTSGRRVKQVSREASPS
jgi:hypothetical protein